MRKREPSLKIMTIDGSPHLAREEVPKGAHLPNNLALVPTQRLGFFR